MKPESGKIHGILSFAVLLIHEDDRASVLRELDALLKQDPALRFEVNSSEHDLVIRGDDELQLREIGRKILSRHQAAIGELQISFRETICQSAEAEGKYIRHVGGSGNYAHVKIHVEPNQAGFEFVNILGSGVLPMEYVQATEQGVRQAIQGGVLAGYEIVDVKAALVGGSYRDVASSVLGFQIAGSIALKDAARRAYPVLLEPVMSVEVTVAEQFVGTAIADLNFRRGRIESMEPSSGSQIIKAMVPLAEVLSFSTHGRPEYPMHFAGYAPVPPRRGPFGDEAAAYPETPWKPRPRTGSSAAEPEE